MVAPVPGARHCYTCSVLRVFLLYLEQEKLITQDLTSSVEGIERKPSRGFDLTRPSIATSRPAVAYGFRLPSLHCTPMVKITSHSRLINGERGKTAFRYLSTADPRTDILPQLPPLHSQLPSSSWSPGLGSHYLEFGKHFLASCET